MAGIPFIGQAAFYGLAREGSYQEFRAEFEAAGDSWEAAREKAMTLSTIAAPMELAMERMQLKFLKGKLPFFEKAMQSATKRINSLPARMATRIGAMTLAEGSIETGQEYINPVLQEPANGLGMDVPDQEWLNGEDGIFDGFWKMHAEMLLVMLPIAVFGGAKGAIADGARVQAFREASDRQLLALGANQQDIDAFRQEAEAGRTGAAAAEMNRLIECY